jgi:hypothetical protein
MKKTIYVTALLFAFATITNAQTTDNREEFQFGIKGGLSYSTIYDSKGEDFKADPRFGLSGGVFLAIPLGTYIGLQPGVFITQKGFKGSGSFLGVGYDFSRRLTFLDIPILFEIKPSEFISIVAGPQFSYLLKQKDSFNDNSNVQEFDNDNIRKNTLGAVGGIDINIKHLVIGGRFGVDFQDNKGDGTSESPRYKNVWGQISVGYQFYN